jgi:hypothetical protein
VNDVFASNGSDADADVDVTSEGYKYIEKFNRDMMDQFLEFQRRSQASFIRHALKNSDHSRDRCYDHNFLRFSTIFGEKIGVFL